MKKTFSIVITTKNRLEELKETLLKIKKIIEREDVECIICDDGSKDETSKFIRNYYPEIKLIKNTKSKGLIFSRNRLLNLTKADYAFSLDDDSNIVFYNSLELVKTYFENNPYCGVIACRIFWGKKLPKMLDDSSKIERVKSFVGCGHVWNLKAWREIPNYPDWFKFYGEEEFASFQLFKKGWEIHYIPEILVHHRVDVSSRKKDKDYSWRLRRSLRSGWYNYFLFYPKKVIPKRFLYTLWMQLKLKVFKGDLEALIAIVQAIFDTIINIPRLLINSNRLTKKEFENYAKLPESKIYWFPLDL